MSRWPSKEEHQWDRFFELELQNGNFYNEDRDDDDEDDDDEEPDYSYVSYHIINHEQILQDIEQYILGVKNMKRPLTQNDHDTLMGDLNNIRERLSKLPEEEKFSIFKYLFSSVIGLYQRVKRAKRKKGSSKSRVGIRYQKFLILNTQIYTQLYVMFMGKENAHRLLDVNSIIYEDDRTEMGRVIFREKILPVIRRELLDIKKKVEKAIDEGTKMTLPKDLTELVASYVVHVDEKRFGFRRSSRKRMASRKRSGGRRMGSRRRGTMGFSKDKPGMIDLSTSKPSLPILRPSTGGRGRIISPVSRSRTASYSRFSRFRRTSR